MRTRTVLFISNHLPRDFTRNVQGGYQRMRMFLEAFARTGWDIRLLFFVLPRENLDPSVVKKDIKEYWGVDATVGFCPMTVLRRSERVSIWQYYIAPALTLRKDLEYGPLCGPDQLQTLVQNLRSEPTAIFVFGLESMLPLTLLDESLPPIYFDLNDIEHRKAMRTLGTLRARKGTWLKYLKVPAVIRAERAAIVLATKTFVCSDADKAYLERKFSLTKIRTIPNAVDFSFNPSSVAETKTILFLGSLSYPPNNAAVEMLVGAIWPSVRRDVPDARLLIVGSGAETVACRRNDSPGVEFLGFVPNVKPYYEQARVFCCPLMAGGGTRIKLIEAAAYGKAIVSTPIGAEGLDFRDGVHALIRDTPELIAQACVELLLDAARASTLGNAARAFAKLKYSRQFVVEKICQELST